MSDANIEKGQPIKAEEVKKAFEMASGGVTMATQNKITEYTLRALRGEPLDQLTEGLPISWTDEIKNRVKSIGRLTDEEVVWNSLQSRVEPVSSFDRKAFEYGWSIIKGADRGEVLQGLPPGIQGRVDTYMNETFKYATEKASENK